MIMEAAGELLTQIKNWFKNNYKFLIVILLYFFYYEGLLFLIPSSFGINVNLLPRFYRMILFVLNDLIYIFILLIMFRKEIIDGIKDLKDNFTKRSILAINCWIVGCFFMTISSIIISMIVKQKVAANEALVREYIKLAPLYMLFTCSLIAPIFEEMVFRRSLHGLIKNRWIFIFISGFSFGLLHVIGNNPSALEYLYIIPYGSMGCAFAYLYSKTKNISIPILVHMIHNTILVTIQILGG